MTDWDEIARETAVRVRRESDRLISEWSTSKVRIRHGDIWWRWDGGGYTADMASAGLYDAAYKVCRKEDKLVPVDPTLFAVDAIMQRLADAERKLNAADVCEACGDCLMPEPPRCERHVRTEPGDPEWTYEPGHVAPDASKCERAIADLTLLDRIRLHHEGMHALLDVLENERDSEFVPFEYKELASMVIELLGGVRDAR